MWVKVLNFFLREGKKLRLVWGLGDKDREEIRRRQQSVSSMASYIFHQRNSPENWEAMKYLQDGQ